MDLYKQTNIKDKLLCPLIDFLKNPQQRVVLNVLMDKGGLQAFHRDQFWNLYCFFIDINNLPNSLQSDPKFFPDETSLFSTIQDITTSTVRLNHDIQKSLNGL